MIVNLDCSDMRKQVESLCEKHKIRVNYKSGGWFIDVRGFGWYPQGRAFYEPKEIEVNEITTPLLYCVAMHEIGHIVSKRGMPKVASYWGVRAKDMLVNELSAWQWALSHCIKEYKEYMFQAARFPMWHYYVNCVQYNSYSYNKRRKVYIPKTKLFWKLVEGKPQPM